MMFLLGAFLSGGVLGFTANRYINRDHVCASPTLLSIMSDRLGLSEAQRGTVDSILDERSRQYRIVTAPIRPQMDSIKENAREQIRRVLTPEQNEGFTALIREMNDTTVRNQQN
jgi:hypothetical protein